MVFSTIEIEYDYDREAEYVKNALVVDEKPKRSKTITEITTDENKLKM